MSTPTSTPTSTVYDDLDESVCWDLLEGAAVGRLAVVIAGWPDIFPINHHVDRADPLGPFGRPTIVFRSGAGTKLAGAVLGRHVAYEVDGYEPQHRTAWSVIVKGRAELVESMMDVYRAQELPLFPWVIGNAPDIVRIVPDSVTGRRYRVFDDAIVDASIGWSPSDPPAEPGVAVAPAPGQAYHPGAPRLRPD